MIMKFENHAPQIDASCFIAKDADVIGRVDLKKNVSVWFHSVIRGDKEEIVIDENSNVQDGCILHTDPNHKLYIGKNVTIGHRAIVHGARIEDNCLIGMGAIILNGAHIGENCMIAAGALVKENQCVPPNSLVVGIPGKVIRKIDEEQVKDIYDNALHYIALAKTYKEQV